MLRSFSTGYFTLWASTDWLVKIYTAKGNSALLCTVEHPFGTVKWYDGAHYLLCKGKEKVTAEIGLSYLAYNLKRAINMVGVKKLIETMG